MRTHVAAWLAPSDPPPRRGGARRGFTIVEITVALGILSVGILLVAQMALWSLHERRRQALREEALEAAANVLEAARAGPWEQLTPEWAAAQRLPASLTAELREAKLNVRVEPEESLPAARRVSVEITWRHEDGTAARPVSLVGLFGTRTAPQPEDKP